MSIPLYYPFCVFVYFNILDDCIPGSEVRGPAANTAAVFIVAVDQSVISNDSISWLQSFIPQLNAELKLKGVGNSSTCKNVYGVVGYNLLGETPVIYTDGEGFADFSQKLFQGETGQFKGRFSGLYTAVGALTGSKSTSKCNIQKNIMFMTNTHMLSTVLTHEQLFQHHFEASGITPHVLLDATFEVDGFVGLGKGSTVGYRATSNFGDLLITSRDVTTVSRNGILNDYSEFALGLGGSVWDMNEDNEDGLLAHAITSVISARTYRNGRCLYCTCRVPSDSEVCSKPLKEHQADCLREHMTQEVSDISIN